VPPLPEKILATRVAYEKRAPPYVGMGPSKWLIRPWRSPALEYSNMRYYF